MKKVIIIGAGPAGLTAAYDLLKKSVEYEVLVIEETDTIGGISRTVNYKGNRMDIGGHRFFSKDQRVLDWWQQFMPIQGRPSFDDKLLGRKKSLEENGPDPEKENRVMLIRQRVSRIFYKKKFFDYPISLKPQTFINMGLVKTVSSGFSYISSIFHKRPNTSLENFYINRFGNVLYAMFFEGYTEKLWGRHPRDISADWGAQRVKGLSIMSILKNIFMVGSFNKSGKVETSLIEEFLYPKYGPGQLWETVADQVQSMGGKVILNAKVTEVTIQQDIISSISYLNQEGKTVKEKADIIISSMSIKDLVKGMGQSVPDKVRQVASGLPYRDFVTMGLLLNKLNLKNKTKIKTINHIIPDCWIYVQDEGVKLGRIQIFNNWSPYMVKDIESKVWIGLEYFCDKEDSFWNMSDEDSLKLAADELIHMGVIDSQEDILDYHKEKIEKAYPAYFDTYNEFFLVREYLDQITNLYCIGRNGQHRYNNMDHSMVTAFEAVNNIINGKKDKSNVWDVNTEQEYHEKHEKKSRRV
ncbi:NAD(P)/FAD-dependent oxidoreductase [[Clostridium] polysaccharolyticum]|uniref:Protoporphyrinogen oxidase n=1 Tax=[Clostridium] polysaccharolyticum TaxID=29364 RepID=A0A1I0D5D2_9FIRM|nr:NAD(P)/FAD-dependent oxidoreductase [[Clostridium] polysaccharolyticum]SET27221.1 Protoporphyrinogen oxidase [[Clostridium] polysaccharolyticum]